VRTLFFFLSHLQMKLCVFLCLKSYGTQTSQLKKFKPHT
jgi:hypothetical protein